MLVGYQRKFKSQQKFIMEETVSFPQFVSKFSSTFYKITTSARVASVFKPTTKKTRQKSKHKQEKPPLKNRIYPELYTQNTKGQSQLSSSHQSFPPYIRVRLAVPPPRLASLVRLVPCIGYLSPLTVPIFPLKKKTNENTDSPPSSFLIACANILLFH